MSDQIRMDGVDIGQLEHLQGELARLADDMDDRCEATRHLNDAISSITDAMDAGRGTTVEDWSPGHSQSPSPKTDVDDWR